MKIDSSDLETFGLPGAYPLWHIPHERIIDIPQQYSSGFPAITAVPCKKLQHRFIPKKGFLLEAGQVSRHVYFIKTGLVRSYYEEAGQQVCSKFMKEGDIIVSVISFFKQKTSYEFIQAMEDCEVYSICYDELQYIYKNFSEFNIIGRILITKYYLLSEQRLYFMRKKKAARRYQLMLKHFPKLILRVPDKYIASYLGITKETLSRIRSGKY